MYIYIVHVVYVGRKPWLVIDETCKVRDGRDLKYKPGLGLILCIRF